MSAIYSWKEALEDIKKQPFFEPLIEFVKGERQSGKVIYPPHHDIFNALAHTEFCDVKVVILGQDPYHGFNQANGLCFSVNKGVPIPPSLRNIYQEIQQDIGCKMPAHGDLSQWAKQGVLLLNTVLTVEAGKAHSHKNRGWEILTDAIISSLNQAQQKIVFLLWGAHAGKKSDLINLNKHTVLKAPHPSPLSAHRGFLGCKHFSKANQILVDNGQAPIQWELSA